MEDSRTDRTELDRILASAYSALGRREHTVVEIRRLLVRRGRDPATVESALEELCGAGLLDDARFAQRFASDKRELEQWGTQRIVSELQRRGVGPQEVATVVGGRARSDELGTALLLLERRLPEAPRNDRERDRAWRLLVRRGYEPELAYEAVREHERRAAQPGGMDRHRVR
jgi:regulatory protein